MLVASAPAFAQDVIVEGDDVQYNGICQNIIGQVNTTITQGASAGAVAIGDGGDGEGAAGGDAEAVAAIAQEAGVSIEQVNECLNGADIGGNGDGNKGDGKKVKTAETEEVNTAAARQYGVIVGTIPKQKFLANTGGPVPLLPALGLLLISSVAIRNILRR